MSETQEQLQEALDVLEILMTSPPKSDHNKERLLVLTRRVKITPFDLMVKHGRMDGYYGYKGIEA